MLGTVQSGSKAGMRSRALFAAPVGHWLLTSIATIPPTGRVNSRARSMNLYGTVNLS